jgi:hypothetical protein
MFNAHQFYPTPRKLALLMSERLLEGRKQTQYRPILDPSAGKGDLLDCFHYTDQPVAIEIDPDLQATLKGKKYAILSHNFLTFNELECYPSIIMNPPFSNGIDHLFHAWEVLSKGGRIICILPNTSLNQSNNKKTALTHLINLYGTVENIGTAFIDSERSTPVEVSLIVLNKPKEKTSFTLESDRFTFESLEAGLTLYGKTGTLGENNPIKTLVNQYNLALQCLKTLNKAQYDLEFALTDIYQHSNLPDNERVNLTSSPTLPEQIKELKSRFWRTVLKKTELYKRSTSDFQKKFIDWEKEQTLLAFTEENITQTLLMFWQNKGQIDLDSACKVFDSLTYYSDNCSLLEGWKTNKHYKLNIKLIVPNIINCDYGIITQSYNHTSILLTDLDKVLCNLSGKVLDNITTIETALRQHLKQVKAGDKLSSPFESTFFNCKVYKKGTIHLTFKDTKLNEDFNLKVAKHRKWLG